MDDQSVIRRETLIRLTHWRKPGKGGFSTLYKNESKAMMRLGSTGDGKRSNGAMAGSKVAFSMVPRVGRKFRMQVRTASKDGDGVPEQKVAMCAVQWRAASQA